MINTLDVVQQLKKLGWQCPVVYDIGAHEGQWTRRWQNVFPESVFCMFEANPLIARPEIDSKHRWFNTVLSDTVGKKVDYYSVGSINCTGNSYYRENTSYFADVKPIVLITDTMDNIMEKELLPCPKFIKIDTQGSEIDILSAAKTLLDHVEVIHTELPILCYNKGAPNTSEYIDFMTSRNFYPVTVDQVHKFSNSNIIIQMDMCFLRLDVLEKYWPRKGKTLIL